MRRCTPLARAAREREPLACTAQRSAAAARRHPGARAPRLDAPGVCGRHKKAGGMWVFSVASRNTKFLNANVTKICTELGQQDDVALRCAPPPPRPTAPPC